MAILANNSVEAISTIHATEREELATASSSSCLSPPDSMGYGTIDRFAYVTGKVVDATHSQSKGRWRQICLASLLGFVCFIVASIVLLANLDMRKSVPSPRGELVASKTAPGFGFDLTPAYGTVAVRYENGSTINLGMVDANTEYRETMKRLSVGGKIFDSMWQDYCGRMFDYSWPNVVKMLRRKLGLPSTQDVAHLKGLVGKLQSVAEQRTGRQISAVVVATPHFPAFCKDDLVEAVKLNGLLPLADRHLTSQPKEWNGAFFGAGFGHCTNYTNLGSCNAEENNFPVLGLLSVSFHNVTLFLRRSTVRKPYDGGLNERDLSIDYKLGSYFIPEETLEAQAYWLRVSDRVRELCGSWYWSQFPIDKVMLLGESAEHPELMRVVKNTIAQLQHTEPDYVVQDPLYIAARGSAELAKRAQEDWATIVSSSRI